MKYPLGKIKVLLTLLFVMLAVNFLAAQAVRQPASTDGEDVRANGHMADAPAETMAAVPGGFAVVQGNGINYHGGPVMHGNVPVYVIWYGNWTNGPKPSDSGTTVNLIDAFLNGLGGPSALELVNSTYGDNAANVSGQLHLQSQVFDTGSQGTSLTNTRLTRIISRALTNRSLPTDANGVYLVLTSSNIKEQGFCTQFCGFHTHQTINGADIKWSFVGNVDQCPAGCEIQTTSPNGDSGADGMANTLSHEIEETISDPDLNAWFDNNGQENGDKCNFNFGPTQTAGNGSQFNQTFGGHNWMLQQNWRNSGGGACAQHL